MSKQKLAQFKNVFWKFYFWLLLVGYIISLFILLSELGYFISNFTSFFITLLHLVIQAVLLIGVYSYAYRKKIFDKLFWKLFFIVIIIHYSVIILNNIITSSYKNFSEILEDVPFFALNLFVIYLLSFKKLKLSK